MHVINTSQLAISRRKGSKKVRRYMKMIGTKYRSGVLRYQTPRRSGNILFSGTVTRRWTWWARLTRSKTRQKKIRVSLRRGFSDLPESLPWWLQSEKKNMTGGKVSINIPSPSVGRFPRAFPRVLHEGNCKNFKNVLHARTDNAEPGGGGSE
jgi:hypothetical protein